MGPRLKIACAVFALAVLGSTLAACGTGSSPADSLLGNVDKARSARTLSTLEQGLIAVQTVNADSGATDAPSLAAALQQRDASNRYTTVPPTEVGIIQVIGGGGGPVMLVGISAPPSSGKPPAYLALWESAGSTLFYLGQQPPQYSASPPSGAGWSSTPPQA
jgi:hypothetical protein